MGVAVEDSLHSSDNNTQYESHPISRTNREEDYYNDVYDVCYSSKEIEYPMMIRTF